MLSKSPLGSESRRDGLTAVDKNNWLLVDGGDAGELVAVILHHN
jgi:hypothetical protein